MSISRLDFWPSHHRLSVPAAKTSTKVVLFTLRAFFLLLCHLTILAICSDLKTEALKA